MKTSTIQIIAGQTNAVNPNRIANTPRNTTSHQFRANALFISYAIFPEKNQSQISPYFQPLLTAHGGLYVYPVFCQFCQQFVSLLLLFKRLAQQINRLYVTQLPGIGTC